MTAPASRPARHLALTGASRGFGAAVAYAASRDGWRVSATVRSDEQARALVSATGALVAVVDARDAGATRTWIEQAVARFGPVDVALANAAVLGDMTSIVDYPLETLKHVLDVNVYGAFVFAQTVLPHLRRPGGRFIAISSYVGAHALAGYGAYSVSKFAVEGLARLVHSEHAAEGVVSVALDPGMIRTDMLAAALSGDAPDDARTPDDAAEALLGLVSRLAPRHSGTTVTLQSA